MDKNRYRLSIVIPLYNESESIPELYKALKQVLSEHYGNNYEILFVNDGSNDDSQQVLETLTKQEKDPIRVIQFQKNYGKSAALSVGFAAASGEIVISMDADLQDDPQEIPALIEKLEEGYDLVSGWKKKRRDPISKRLPSRIFNFVTAKMSGVKIHDINCGLKAYRADVVKRLHPYGEMHRYLPVLAHLDGFRVGEVQVKHHQRKYGKTKFGISRFTSGFFDLITVLFLTRYTQKPLHLFGILGVISFLIGFGISLYLSIQRLLGIWIGNRPLFFLGILMIIVGVQFISIGLLGEMISESQKTRQDYVIRKFIGISEDELKW